MPEEASACDAACTIWLRICIETSSVVNSPSVPTISVMKRPGSVTRME